jgi:hypothetical protein
MGINFERELPQHGYDLGRGEFYDLVQEVRADLFPAWSVDELACHPQDAVRFCRTVRGKAEADVPDHLIMHALLNARKH